MRAYSQFGTLSEQWNGSRRNVVPRPDVPGGDALFLFSAVALPNGVVWSVGKFFQTLQNPSRTSTQRWTVHSGSILCLRCFKQSDKPGAFLRSPHEKDIAKYYCRSRRRRPEHFTARAEQCADQIQRNDHRAITGANGCRNTHFRYF